MGGGRLISGFPQWQAKGHPFPDRTLTPSHSASLIFAISPTPLSLLSHKVLYALRTPRGAFSMGQKQSKRFVGRLKYGREEMRKK